MTTGLFTAGATNSGFYARKRWTGDDDVNKKIFNYYDADGCIWLRSETTQYSNGVFLRRNYLYYPSKTMPEKWSTTDEYALLQKVKLAMQGHQSNLSISAAELPEAIQTLSNSVLAALRFVNCIISRDWRGALRAAAALPGQKKDPGNSSTTYTHNKRGGVVRRRKTRAFTARLKAGDVSGAWLAAQYAWIPTVNDIYEQAKLVEALTSGPRSLRLKVKKTVKSEWEASASPSMYSLMFQGVRTRKYYITLQEEVHITRQLGLANPLGVVWEKMPWSFVVDWFIPIGTYLDLSSFFDNYGIRANVVEFARGVGSLTRPAKNAGSITYVGGSYKGSYWTLTRTPRVALVAPTPDFNSLAKAFSLGHLKNAAALIASAVFSSKTTVLSKGSFTGTLNR